MKKVALFIVVVLWSLTTTAQPRPYEIDASFIPTLEYLQKSWSGEYDGLEPNSKMILSIKRTLVLYPDLSYTNVVMGRIKDEPEILLKKESGTYQYSFETQLITYTIEIDSTLDINNYLQGKYKQEGKEKTSLEKAQFTGAANDVERQWVLFDQQLQSPVDPRQKAVYVMTGQEIDASKISSVYQRGYAKDVYYDLNGRRIKAPGRGVTIVNGKKIIR